MLDLCQMDRILGIYDRKIKNFKNKASLKIQVCPYYIHKKLSSLEQKHEIRYWCNFEIRNGFCFPRDNPIISCNFL